MISEALLRRFPLPFREVSLKSRLWAGLTQQPTLKPSQEAFLSVFQRGKGSRVWLNKRKLQEVTTARSSYTDLGLSVLTRLGLPFVKLPGVFQVQPYIQLPLGFKRGPGNGL